MTRVYKYTLFAEAEPSLNLPVGALIRCVHAQHDQVCLWAEIDPDQTKFETREFAIYGTGHDMVEGPRELCYLGTAFLAHDNLVLHVYEYTRVN